MAGSEVAPVALCKAASLPGADGTSHLPESSWCSVTRRLLGPPLVNEQLHIERLSKPLGLGVLSCDGIGVAREAFGGGHLANRDGAGRAPRRWLAHLCGHTERR